MLYAPSEESLSMQKHLVISIDLYSFDLLFLNLLLRTLDYQQAVNMCFFIGHLKKYNQRLSWAIQTSTIRNRHCCNNE